MDARIQVVVAMFFPATPIHALHDQPIYSSISSTTYFFTATLLVLHGALETDLEGARRRMERALIMLLLALILLSVSNINTATSEYWDGPARVIHVGGKVVCQDCTQGWNQWAHEGSPIKGCKVAVTCRDERKRVVYYASDETDEEGEYDIAIDKRINGKELNAAGCSLRLVSSPDPQCNILTDFAGGKSGVKLRRPSHIYRDEIKYALKPLFFTSPMCDEPDTSHDQNPSDHHGGNY